MRVVGLDIHRVFAEAVLLDGGRVMRLSMPVQYSPIVPVENSPLRCCLGPNGGWGLPRCSEPSGFWWPSAATRRFGNWAWDALRSQDFRDEIGVLAQAVAGALDMHDDGVVKQSVQQRGRDDWISKNLTPFGETAVRSQNHGPLLVAGIHQLEE